MPERRQAGPLQQDKTPRVEIYWHAVTYRSVILYISLIVAGVLAILYLMRPDLYSNVARAITQNLGAAAPTTASLAQQNQAHFVNLDGKVEVKKVSSVSWAAADYRTTLDKGDLIRTGSDGAARITFVDGTTYTVKNDSFVTVEENSIDRDRTTTVGVSITSGAVDLTTGTWDSPRSKAEVSFANARASVQENSHAAVSTDPVHDHNEITVSEGSATMSVGSQQIEIGKWERASFATNGPVTKTMVLAPPELTQPLNLEPLIEPDPRRATVHFGWETVPEAVSYRLRVSTNAMFTRVVKETTTADLNAEVSGLDAGDYFWSVTAIDASKHESAPSDPFKFTLAAKGKTETMLLEVDSPVLHGNVVELSGQTEPGAALIVNGESVADIRSDGHFRFFTPQLSRGSHVLAVTGQNRRGGTNTWQGTIVIP
jgi:FecR protein